MPRERAKERACDKAITRTLAYRAVFKYPLSYYQLQTTLICREKFGKQLFDRELNKMVKKGYVGYRDGKYFFKGIKPVSWEHRQKQFVKGYTKIIFISKILSAVPWIKMLAITGSLAAYNSDKDSDIDIFIITQTHRMWLTRGFVSILLKAMNAYAQGGIGPNKVCTNLYIDEEVLEWPLDQRSVFTAHEIFMMHPLINRGDTYFKFLLANKWINDYFGFFNISPELFQENLSTKTHYGSRLVNLLEKTAKKMQINYMNMKRTNEVIGDHIIHFKKNDNTNWILAEYSKLTNKA